MPRGISPSTSYGHEIWAAYKAGATKIHVVKFATRAKAKKFVERMHKLRAALRAEQHPFALVADKVTLSIREVDGGTNKWEVTFGPADDEFSNELAKAGVSMDPEDFSLEEEEELARISEDKG